MHQHLCTRSKSQTLAAIPFFGPPLKLLTLVGMGSAALATAVSHRAKRFDFPARDNEALRKQTKNNNNKQANKKRLFGHESGALPLSYTCSFSL